MAWLTYLKSILGKPTAILPQEVIEGIPLSARNYWICEQMDPTWQARELIFVGLEMIGDYFTEINITANPTGAQCRDAFSHLNDMAKRPKQQART